MGRPANQTANQTTHPRGERRCAGWPEEAFDLLLRLDGEPTLAERERHRRDRERLVRKPMIELLQDVADADEAYEDFHVWGFAKMLWPWQRQAGMVRVAPSVELAVSFDLDGLAVQCSWWYAPGEQVERYRASVAGDAGAELAEIVEGLAGDGYEIGGDLLKRVPRGYAPDHPRAELLRHRSLTAARPVGGEAWLHTPEVVDRVLAEFAALRPLTSWFAENAGPELSATGPSVRS